MPWSLLARAKAGEVWTKLRGRRFAGQGMVAAGGERVRRGFASLSGDEFDRYNLPQVWVERRQIPRVLDGRAPRAAAVVLDLGCGPGDSTAILCHFAHPGWRVIGFDFTDALVEAARERASRRWFRTRDGADIVPHFEHQDIAQPLRVGGRPMEPASVDLAISCGVVGLYLDPARAGALVRELARVLKPGSVAALDCGPAVTARALESLFEQAGFRPEARVGCCPLDPRPKIVARLAPLAPEEA